eukprot:scaffold482_cov266-Amphora_coffeaeformis.AAC.3
MNICVVRLFGPAVAKTTVPRALVTLTGSSFKFCPRHLAWTVGSPLMPNWAIKPGMTRKIRHPSQNPEAVNCCGERKRKVESNGKGEMMVCERGFVDNKKYANTRNNKHTSKRSTPRGAHEGCN